LTHKREVPCFKEPFIEGGIMKTIFLIICLVICSILLCSYSVEEFGVEQHLFHNDHHFLSVIMIDDVCALRPHPGNDINGWGSTLYLQPFLPAAVLGHTVLNEIEALNEGVSMSFTGLISYGGTGNWGVWSSELFFTYSASEKVVNGSGIYNIQLSESLSSVSGDLNLVKIASNYLHDVPLLDPPYQGDTGDMEFTIVNGSGAGFPFTWNPVENPGYFPGFVTDSLSIDVSGRYNNVDTSDSTGVSIEPAWKPSLHFTIDASDSAEMIFGAIYDLEHSTEFWSDNIGITPLILQNTEQTDFSFAVSFESTTDEPDTSSEQNLADKESNFLYPNPLKLSNSNRDVISIRLNELNRSHDKITIGVFNIKGQTIMDSVIYRDFGAEITLSKKLFTVPGVYLIKIQAAEISFVEKLTVIR
jgi:hypothetical protein